MAAKIEQSGVELNRKRLDMVTGSLRPTGDKIVVKPLPLKLSETIVAHWNGKTVRGEVMAVGPGEHPNIYNRDRSKRWQSKHFRKTEVKPGQIVELGGLEINGYDFPRIMLNGEEVIICSEKDVAVVRD